MVEITRDAARIDDNGTKWLAVGVIGDPFSPSFAYTNSLVTWTKIRDLLAGADEVRRKGTTYLPRFTLETDADYKERLKFAPFEGHFADAVDAISDKPFTKPVKINDDVSDQIKAISEDVDGEGTKLHTFAKTCFYEGAAFGTVGIFVDYPELGEGATKADERNLQARPYWILLRAEDVLAVYYGVRGARKYISHLRFIERSYEMEGFREVERRKVRVYDDANGTISYRVYESVGGGGMEETSNGVLKGINEIPYAEFLTGKRERFTNRMIPPMAGLAELQIEHYQQSSNLKHILNNTAFPMLVGNNTSGPGVDPTTGKPVPLQVGPKAVLFAPPVIGSNAQSAFAWLEPSGNSIQKLMENLDRLETAIDKLGKAPLIKSTGNVTATSDAINAAKGQALAESWAGLESEALEKAFRFTCEWMRDPSKVHVSINTEFGITDNATTDTTELRNNYTAGTISRETLWEEMQRRAVLGPQFNAAVEKERLAGEQADKLAQAKAAQVAGFNLSGQPLPPPPVNNNFSLNKNKKKSNAPAKQGTP